MITVLVTGAGGGVGQGIIKSLKLIDDIPLRIIGADMSEWATGLYAADVACLVESCHSPGYMASLARIFSAYRVDYYFPGTDVELAFCAQYKSQIYQAYGVHTVISSAQTIAIADDKYRTYAFLQAAGLAHPRTEYLAQTDVDSWHYPVIVKPAVGCRSIGVYKVASAAELTQHQYQAEGLLVQEYIGEASDEYTCTLVKVGEQVSPVLALKRVLRAGDTYRAQPVKSARIEQYVRDVAAHLDIDGGCNFQLRLDAQGQPKLFEINSRFSGTTPFCAHLGFNPLAYYLKARLGQACEVNIDYDAVVLRYWMEAVVAYTDLTRLVADKMFEPSRPEDVLLVTRRASCK
ncbi:MAG: ATP-grasp domain-containing protein [Thiomicrospira sp.]